MSLRSLISASGQLMEGTLGSNGLKDGDTVTAVGKGVRRGGVMVGRTVFFFFFGCDLLIKL